ncbi:hypothetical protein [Streptomyces mirabilis]
MNPRTPADAHPACGDHATVLVVVRRAERRQRAADGARGLLTG